MYENTDFFHNSGNFTFKIKKRDCSQVRGTFTGHWQGPEIRRRVRGSGPKVRNSQFFECRSPFYIFLFFFLEFSNRRDFLLQKIIRGPKNLEETPILAPRGAGMAKMTVEFEFRPLFPLFFDFILCLIVFLC